MNEESDCVDINECDLEIHSCSSFASCANVDGGYECECSDGFYGNGTFCLDIDECLIDSCDENAECINTSGSFICKCNLGYSQNVLGCQNIDECLLNPCDQQGNKKCFSNSQTKLYFCLSLR